MAKRIVKWTLDGSILKLSKYTDDKEAALIIEAEFDLNNFQAALNKPENKDYAMQALTYLAKQKLMDSGASNVGDFGGKILAAKNRWKELLEGRWTGERVNATGKAAEKAAYQSVKQASQVKTLGGLLIKYTLSKTPGQPKLTDEEMVSFKEMAEKAGIPID